MDSDHAALVATQRFWVAEPDGDVAGVLVLVPPDHHVLVENLAVLPDRQGWGITVAR